MSNNDRIIQQIEAIEQQLRVLKLEVAGTGTKKQKKKKLVLGQTVRILNPKQGQETKGVIVKINYSTRRATVETEKGRLWRIFSNLKPEQDNENDVS
jgi:hypothetical protein